MTKLIEYKVKKGEDPEHVFTKYNYSPRGWIQWKGTDVCMDVRCKCGFSGHIDGEFAYHVKCGRCGTAYVLSPHVQFVETEEDPDSCIVYMDDDGDDYNWIDNELDFSRVSKGITCVDGRLGYLNKSINGIDYNLSLKLDELKKTLEMGGESDETREAVQKRIDAISLYLLSVT